MRDCMNSLLEVKNLKTYFQTDKETIPAVDGVSFTIEKGKTLGLVGESGSGKSITSLSILQLIQKPYGKIVDGSIRFNGTELVELGESEMQKIRGNNISMIFQEPMTSLNPVFTVGNQIEEVLILHQKFSKKEARQRAIDLLKTVGIPMPEKCVDNYPHQLSGGMKQRVMIAIALACKPDLLIADEPTTALDVTTQSQILKLMRKLQKDYEMGLLLITHDLGVVAEICDEVAVMYLGRIVEYADVYTFFKNPKHPYSKGLLNSIPSIDGKVSRLSPIKGQVPKPTDIKEGCRFCTRCEFAIDLCFKEEPNLTETTNHVRCWMYHPETKAKFVEG